MSNAFAFAVTGAYTGTYAHDRNLRIPTSFAYPSRSNTKSNMIVKSSIDDDNDVNVDMEVYKDHSIQDSFNLIVLGDLHLEDDMSNHNQARLDCLHALTKLSLLTSPPPHDNDDDSSMIMNGDGKVSNCNSKGEREDSIEMSTLLPHISTIPGGELTEAQLEILLAQKKQQPQQQQQQQTHNYLNSHIVSLGDLGRKDIRHSQGDAGTTLSFTLAKHYLDDFDQIPYNLVTGNHDLEGLDEFDTDEANLQAWMDCFGLSSPYFQKYIGPKTLLVGLSTVRFRDSPHSSHECHADAEQLAWFEDVVSSHPESEGWRILVFTHAPIMGSKLRVLQNVHVVNGCAWMNHCSDPDVRSLFIKTVESCPQIKLWCSGHFHLSQNFEDSLSRVNQCTFAQVGVVGAKSTRDGARQTRIVQGNRNEMRIYSVNHHIRDEDGQAEVRLDAVVDFNSGDMELQDREEDSNSDNEHNASTCDQWFGAYIPREEDGCYVEDPSGAIATQQDVSNNMVCWWHMDDGCVLGVHDGQVVEYDPETLSPLGIVVGEKELRGREVLVVDDSKAVVLVDPNKDGEDVESMEVIHPNDDGSYWRKYQRNKRVRQEEKARELAAKLWMERARSESAKE